MTEIELKNIETLKKFYVGDHVMHVGADNISSFGTVIGFECTKQSEILVTVECITPYTSYRTQPRCFSPETLTVIK